MMYTEIKRLHAMLDEAGIPNDFWATDAGYEKSYHLCYPDVEKGVTVCSVIQSPFSYGGEDNRLEIMGLLTDEEREEDDVVGWLTAEEVFARIAFHWKAMIKRGNKNGRDR